MITSNMTLFYRWFIDWYKTILNEVTIMISFPNELQPFKEDNVIILSLFEKIDQSINAKIYLQQIIDKAKEYSLTIYLEASPRHKNIESIEHKNKITKDYLINYFSNFGFKITSNKNFMKL